MLSIVIPTRARTGKVYAQIQRVNAQLKGHKTLIKPELLVVENHSTDLLDHQKLREFGWEIKTEQVDFGGNHNFCNAIISASSEYVWILGDHHVLDANAVSKVYAAIEKYKPDCLIINELGLNSKFLAPQSQRELFESVDGLGPLIHTSGYIVKRKTFSKYCLDSILYQSTFVPQLVFVLNALKKGKLILVEDNLFSNHITETKHKTELYMVGVFVCMGLNQIEIFLEASAYKSWAKLIQRTRRNWITPKGIIYELAKHFHDNRELRSRLFNLSLYVRHLGLFRFCFYKVIGNIILNVDGFTQIYARTYENLRGYSVSFRPSIKFFED